MNICVLYEIHIAVFMMQYKQKPCAMSDDEDIILLIDGWMRDCKMAFIFKLESGHHV